MIDFEEIKSRKRAQLSEIIKSLPLKPGIYQYKDSSGKIIYIGKAIKLRNRVKSYFQQGKVADAKTNALVGKIEDIEVIVTDSEAEALILEDTLVKKHKPRYNILLRDDKTYPFVRITKEDYPQIFKTRTIVKDGSKYFGPYTDVGNINQLLRVIRTIFKLRSCDYKLDDKNVAEKKYKLCLDYQINRCEGPCQGLISKADYRKKITAAVQILNGKTKDLEKQFEKEMIRLSEEFKFEEAVELRNKLTMLKEYTAHQKLVSNDLADRDVFAVGRYDTKACTIIFKIRDGKLVGKRHYIINSADDHTDGSLIQRTIEKWYLENEFIPREIVMSAEADDPKYIMSWLESKSEHPVHIHIPQKGDKKKLVMLAETNALYILKEHYIAQQKREQSSPRAVHSLKRDLKLKNLPKWIECFDNSHIQGSELVSSLVVFENGKPKRSEYRKFKIKTVDKNDDFAAMRETIYRRYKRRLDENHKLPDLIIVDGGKGQLSSAVSVLKNLGVYDDIIIIGLAKKLEEIFFPNKTEPIILPKTSSSLRLIQQLRDEAHRFAITFHRQQRSARTIKTELTEIEGVGRKSAEKLLINFGSVKEISKKTVKELNMIVNKKTSKSIFDYFNSNSEGNE